jgi:thioredoxin-related protein
MSGLYQRFSLYKRIALRSAIVSCLLFTSTLLFSATPIGDDGLHKPDWLNLTFRDISEDISDATSEGKRHVVMFEQKGCIYCEKMHETVLQDPEVVAYIEANYSIVQYNLYGDEEVIDTDGEVLTEKSAAEKWGINFTPTWIFLPGEVDGTLNAVDAADGDMHGAFGKGTFLDMLTWINNKGYDGDEGFQRFHARRIQERQAAAGNNAASEPTD